MQNKKINCVLDFDPGVDDSAALYLIKAEQKINLLAMTSVSGNVSIEDTTLNMQYLANLLNLDVKMAKGQARPLVREAYFTKVHGNDGIAGLRSFIATQNPPPLSSLNAVAMLREVISSAKEKVCIIAVGPLTNIALLIRSFPELREKIDRISIMGGSITSGNVTCFSEFNFYVDPEAAKIVFESGLDIVMSGLQITNRANISKSDFEKIKKSDTKKSVFASEILTYYLKGDGGIHDPCAVMALTHPEIFKREKMYIRIDTGVEKRGMSYRDRDMEEAQKYNCEVLTDIDVEKFSNILTDALI